MTLYAILNAQTKMTTTLGKQEKDWENTFVTIVVKIMNRNVKTII